MGLVTPDVLGRNERCYVMRENIFGTYVPPGASATAADTSTVRQGQFIPLKTQMGNKKPRKNRADKRSTRSNFGRIQQQTENTWSLETYLLPPAVDGSTFRDPDCAPFILTAMGTRTAADRTSTVFGLSSGQTGLGSLSWISESNSVSSEALSGAWVEEMKLTLAQGDEPKLTFNGGAKSYIHCGYTTVGADAANNATSITVTDGRNFDVGAYVQIGTSTASGVGHKITAASETSITVSPGLTGAQASGVDIIPFVPTHTVHGNPIAGIDGSLQIRSISGGGSSFTTYVPLEIVSADFTLKNNIKPVKTAFAAEVPDIIPGIRDVSGELVVRARRDQHWLFGSRRDFIIQEILVTCGTGTGLTVAVYVRSELEFGELDIPESDEGTIKVPFMGLASSSTAQDEMTLTIA